MRWLLAALLFIPSLALAQAKYGVTAGCNCTDSQVANGGVDGTYCSASTITYQSAGGTNVSITLDQSYPCGQYANGDVWIAGLDDGAGGLEVCIDSVSPALATSGAGSCSGCSGIHHGWDVDPSSIGRNAQNLDGRISTSFTSPATAHPIPGCFDVDDGYRSFIKADADTTSCVSGVPFWEVCWNGTTGAVLDFAPVFTFVECSDTTDVPGCTYPADTNGDGRTDDEFRPAWFGAQASKLGGVNWSDLENLDRLGTYDNTQISSTQKNSFTCEHIASLYRHPRLDILGNYGITVGDFSNAWQLYAHENSSAFSGANCSTNSNSGCRRYEYGLDNRSAQSNTLMRFTLDDEDYTSMSPGDDCYQAVAGFLQISMDQVALMNFGGTSVGHKPYFANGGHIGGRKEFLAFAKMMLSGHSTYGTPIQNALDGKRTYADYEYHIGENGIPYHGATNANSIDCSSHPYYTNGSGGSSGNRYNCACSESAGNPAELDNHCCAGVQDGLPNYVVAHMLLGSYTALGIRNLGLQNAWDDDDWLTLMSSIALGGRGPGHTKGIYCSPDGSGGTATHHNQTPWEIGNCTPNGTCNPASPVQGYTFFGNDMVSAFMASPATPIDFDESATCGNGILEGSETCDDCNTSASDGCSATCTVESGWTCDTSDNPHSCPTVPSTYCGQCGDSTINGTEQCDDGGSNGDTMPCTASCVTAFCDDGLVCSDGSCTSGPSSGPEDCDDGATLNANTNPCTATCADAICGDNLLCSNASCTTGPGFGPEECDGTDDAQCPSNCDGSCGCTGGDSCGDDVCGPTENTTGCFEDCAEIEYWLIYRYEAEGGEDPVLDTVFDPWPGGDVEVTPLYAGLGVQVEATDALIDSVQFELDADTSYRCENLAPWDMGPAPAAPLSPDPGLGEHTFRATPYSGTDCGGTAGQTSVVVADFVVAGVCADGSVDGSEECDDGGAADGDGCSGTCSVELKWQCAGEPSACETIAPTTGSAPVMSSLDRTITIAYHRGDESDPLQSVELHSEAGLLTAFDPEPCRTGLCIDSWTGEVPEGSENVWGVGISEAGRRGPESKRYPASGFQGSWSSHDVNRDGEVNVVDILGVSQVIFGLAGQNRCYARPLPLELPYADPELLEW